LVVAVGNNSGMDRDKNNLAVVANRAYNYDRVRKSDEGTDW
jgi:hypothetical protein